MVGMGPIGGGGRALRKSRYSDVDCGPIWLIPMKGRVMGSTKMAAAWIQAAQDLGFEFDSPFVFTGSDGKRHQCSGLIRHIGSPTGTMIVSRDDPEFEVLHEVCSGLGFYESALSPRYYEKYDRARFMETLRDCEVVWPTGETTGLDAVGAPR